MKEPEAMIHIRRNPLPALGLLVLGGGMVGLALYWSWLWMVFVGVLFIGGGALILINPAVSVGAKVVIVKNVLGMPSVEYPHDGIGQLSIHDDKLLIRHEGQYAVLERISRSNMHAGDWRFLCDRLEEANAMSREKQQQQASRKTDDSKL